MSKMGVDEAGREDGEQPDRPGIDLKLQEMVSRR